VAARDLERTAVDADSNAQPLLNRAEMPIVLTEEFGEKAMVVEVKFERIFRDYLRNCCFDSRAALNDFSSIFVSCEPVAILTLCRWVVNSRRTRRSTSS